jgi:isochorismate hydrolase
MRQNCAAGFNPADVGWGQTQTSRGSNLIAHTCVEVTVRFAAELGYEVTTVRDAIADYSDRHMQAALVTNLPNYATAIVTTAEIVNSISCRGA